MNMDAIEPINENISLSDIAIEHIGNVLKDRITWLDRVFGRAWKIERIVNYRRYREPCVYTAENRYGYLSLMPSKDLGNYAFFAFRDPETFQDGRTERRLSVIFWFNVEDILGRTGQSPNPRNTEYIKSQVLAVLRDIYSQDFSLTVEKCYEEYRNVFDGYTVDDNDNQAFVHPYAGFRFDCSLVSFINCINQ